MIPYGRQDISESDIDAVVDVLRSPFLTQGPVVPKFEASVSSSVGAHFAVSVNSATSALHIAMLALGVGCGDIVWTSPITFVASSNAALYCGASVDFVDIDRRTGNLCVSALAHKLEHASLSGRLPKVVVPVHMSGNSCEMATIKKLSEKFGFKVLEDASHAIGGQYGGLPVGSCAYSDIAVFSFHPVKIITTGEGGMAVTNDLELHSKMEMLRSHGITRDPKKIIKSDGEWYYEQQMLGFNYRMTDLAAALGLSQMTRLQEFINYRNQLASKYDDFLSELPLTLPKVEDGTLSSRHLYVIQLERPEHVNRHATIFSDLRDRGVGVNLHYIPVYRQPYYASMDCDFASCPQAEQYYASAISIPLYHGMSDQDQTTVITALAEVLV